MNRRVASFLWAVSIEIIAYPFVICLGALFSDIVFTVSGFLTNEVKWFWPVVFAPLALAGFSYTKMDDLLNPKGKRGVLLDWPDYQLLKDLAIATGALYIFGQVVALLGVYILVISKHPFGLILILAALLQVGFTFGTLLLAYWKSREILGE